MKVQTAAPLSYQSPGLPRVFAAMAYDGLLLIAVSIAYGAIVVALRVLIQGAPVVGQRIQWDLISGTLISLGWFALLVFFYAYFWHRFGQTLGMKTWRLQLVDAQTLQLASYQQCITRSFAAIISLLAVGGGYWLKLFHPQQKMLHDLVSGTQLILLNKQ